MEILFAVALVVALLLPGELLSLPSWLAGAPPGDAAPAPEPGQPLEDPATWTLFDERSIRRRLDALTEELDRLDHDPGVYARGFRTTVALAAYEALLADAQALARRPAPAAGATLEVEILAPSRGSYEELDL